MPDAPDGDSVSTYLLSGLVTALASVVGTVVALAKYIESKYVTEVKELKDEMVVLKQHTLECNEDRLQLSVRVAQLEQINKLSE